MIRTQIQLTDEQMRKLRRAARAHGVSIAEMVRRLVEKGVEEVLPDRRATFARAASHIGAFRDRDSATDVSQRHDEYLDRAFR